MNKSEALALMENLQACRSSRNYVREHASNDAADIWRTCRNKSWLTWMAASMMPYKLFELLEKEVKECTEHARTAAAKASIETASDSLERARAMLSSQEDNDEWLEGFREDAAEILRECRCACDNESDESTFSHSVYLTEHLGNEANARQLAYLQDLHRYIPDTTRR